MDSTNIENEQISFLGGKLGPVLFSLDSNSIFVVKNSNILVYDLKFTLKTTLITNYKIKAIALDYFRANSCKIYAISNNYLFIFDYFSGSLLNSYNIDKYEFINEINVVNSKVFLLAKDKQKNSYKIISLNFTKQKHFTTNVLFEAKNLSNCSISKDGNFLCVITNKFKITIYNLQTKEIFLHQHNVPITCATISGNTKENNKNFFIAFGDHSGKIFIKHQHINACTELHWHAHKVSSVVFTSDNNYLLSVGEESVIVIWHLTSNTKSFIARISNSPLKSIIISPDDTWYLVLTVDNCVKLINIVTSTVTNSLNGIYLSNYYYNEKSGYEMVTDPKTNFLVIIKSFNSIAFYDYFHDKISFELPVIARNYISRTNEKPITPIKVSKLCFTFQGDWLVISESRPKDKECNFHIVVLKFFFNNNSQYSLNTIINNPHNSSITILKSHPHLNLVVSSCSDKNFRIWALNQTGDRSVWHNEIIGVSFKEMNISNIEYSSDGSILAVLCNSFIVIYDSTTLSLLHVFSYSSHSDQILTNVSFIDNFIITSSSQTLYVYDSISLSLCWAYSLDIVSFTISPLNSFFAVLVLSPSKNYHILIFSVNSAIPIKTFPIDNAEFTPRIKFVYENKTRTCSLLVMKCAYELLLFDNILPDSASEDINALENNSNVNNIDAKIQTRSIFDKLFSKSLISVEPEKKLHQEVLPKTNIVERKDLFSIPSQLLPPLPNVFDTFIDSFLPRRSNMEESISNNEILSKNKIDKMDIEKSTEIMTNHLFSHDDNEISNTKSIAFYENMFSDISK